MNNYEFMAMAKKLSDTDDQKNLITGLVITTIVLGGYAYLQYHYINEQRKESLWLKNSLDQLKENNKRQAQINQQLGKKIANQQEIITDLQRSNQELARKVKDSQNQAPAP